MMTVGEVDVRFLEYGGPLEGSTYTSTSAIGHTGHCWHTIVVWSAYHGVFDKCCNDSTLRPEASLYSIGTERAHSGSWLRIKH